MTVLAPRIFPKISALNLNGIYDTQDRWNLLRSEHGSVCIESYPEAYSSRQKIKDI